MQKLINVRLGLAHEAKQKIYSQITSRVHPVHAINSAQCQAAVNLWIKLISLSH